MKSKISIKSELKTLIKYYFRCIKLKDMSPERMLSNRVLNLKPSATIKMSQLAREYRAMGKDVISLSLGEPDFDTPEHIKEFAKQALDEGYTKYTPVNGLIELRQAICQKLKRDNNLEFTPDQIVVSNGAKQSISNLCNALVNDGDEVVLFTPYWVSYADITELAGGRPIMVKASVEDDFKVTASALKEVLSSKTKMIIFSSPCNPTGSVYTKDELSQLVEVIDDYKDVIVVSDEIYEYINFTDRHISIGTFPQIKDRTVTVNGFSKGFAMTGWRLGYTAGPAWLAKACSNIQGQCTSGATAFGQKAASKALLADMGPTTIMKAAFLKRRELILSLLNEIPGIICNKPQGAFYVFPNISSFFGKTDGTELIQNSEDFCRYILEEALVAVVPGVAFGNDQCFRISYATSEDQLTEAISRIKNALSKLK